MPLEDSPDFKSFDALEEPGVTTKFPGTGDTLLGDLSGFRSALAAQNVSFTMRSANIFVAQLNDTGQPRSPQRYNGQRFTLQSSTNSMNLSWRGDKLGLPDTTITAGIVGFASSLRLNAPNTIRLRTLSVHQKLFDGKVEIKAGYLSNVYEYVGLFTGGSPVLAAGLGGLIPIQAGLSGDPVATPGVNVTVHGRRGLYAKAGIQRSVSPYGRPFEIEANPGGFQFGAPGAGALKIAELGLLQPAGPQNRQMWLRLGALHNASRFTRFDGRGTSSNKVIYGAADLQILQSDAQRPAAGIYAGVSAFWGSSSVNTFTQSYEARIYTIGLSPKRPRDSASLKVTYNKYSPSAAAAVRRGGQYANNDQWNATLGYSAHVRKGIYIIPSVSYISSPSLSGNFNDALIASATLFFLF